MASAPVATGDCHSLVSLTAGGLGCEVFQAAGVLLDSESIPMLCQCSCGVFIKAVAFVSVKYLVAGLSLLTCIPLCPLGLQTCKYNLIRKYCGDLLENSGVI